MRSTRVVGARRPLRLPAPARVVCALGGVVAVLFAAACGSAAHTAVVLPATAKLSMSQAAARLCDAGLRVRILETSALFGRALPTASPQYSASPALQLPATRVLATGTTPAAGSSVAKGSVVELRVVAPAGTLAAIRLPPGCQAPPAVGTGTAG